MSENITAVVGSVVTIVTDVIGVFMEPPLIYIVGFVLVGAAFALVRKMFRVGR